MSKTKLILTLAAAMLTAQVQAVPLRDNVETTKQETKQEAMLWGLNNVGLDALRACVAILDPLDPGQRVRVVEALNVYIHDGE